MDRHLILMGGGKKPQVALKYFLGAASRTRPAKILVIGWASAVFEEGFADFERDLLREEPAENLELFPSPVPPTSESEKIKLLQFLKDASGVFILGGDQTLIMDGFKDPLLHKCFLKAYTDGTVFAGTSAGTAVMSSKMIYGESCLKTINGNNVWMREGLGIIPATIFDQHFFKRMRQNRLFSAVTAYPCHLGIGIDEDAALLITNEWEALAIAGPSLIVKGNPLDSASVSILNPGEKFDIQAHVRLKDEKSAAVR